MNLEFGREVWVAEGIESRHVTTVAMGLDNSSKDMSAEERRDQKTEPWGTPVS